MNTLSANSLLLCVAIAIVGVLLLRHVLFVRSRRAAIERWRARFSAQVAGLAEAELLALAKQLDPNGVAALERKRQAALSENGSRALENANSAAGLQKQWIAALRDLIVERQLSQIRWSST
jgi:hypothetical protein